MVLLKNNFYVLIFYSSWSIIFIFCFSSLHKASRSLKHNSWLKFVSLNAKSGFPQGWFLLIASSFPIPVYGPKFPPSPLPMSYNFLLKTGYFKMVLCTTLEIRSLPQDLLLLLFLLLFVQWFPWTISLKFIFVMRGPNLLVRLRVLLITGQIFS